MKRLFSYLLLLMLSQFAIAQSSMDNGAILDAPRTYKKMSGNPITLRPGEADKIDKQTNKIYSKIMQANQRARKKAARELAYKYKLGERVIIRGDSGRDVRSVANALLKKLYIKEDDIVHTSGGGVLYDGVLYDAMLRFQKDKGLPETGVIDKRVVKELRKRK